MRSIILLVFIFLFKTNSIAQTKKNKKAITWSDEITITINIDSIGAIETIEGQTFDYMPIYKGNQIIIPSDNDTVTCYLDNSGKMIKIQSARYPLSFTRIFYDNDGYMNLCQRYNDGRMLNEIKMVYEDENLYQINTKEFRPDGSYFGTQTLVEYTNYGNFENIDLILNHSLINGLFPTNKFSEKSSFNPNLLLTSFFGKPSRNLAKAMSIYITYPNKEYLETYGFTYHRYGDESISIEIDNQYGKNKTTRHTSFIIKEN